jgi:peptidoglycan/xylan/chitin deacetylase (PgdA/CDA1 family)
VLALSGVVAAVACEPSAETTLGTSRAALTATPYRGTSLAPKTLALTFDDGPSARGLEISRYLKSLGVRATFFVTGAKVGPTALPNPHGTTPDPAAATILAELARDGHLVASHATTHRNLTTEVPDAELVAELAETDALLAPYRVPPQVRAFRAPYGAYDARVHAVLAASPMNAYVGPLGWDMGGRSDRYPRAAADWACFQGDLRTSGGALANGTGYATSTQCADAYLAEIESVGRGVVLMHEPYAWASGNTEDLLRSLVPRLVVLGYRFVRVDEIPELSPLFPCHTSCATCTGPEATQCATCRAGDTLRAGACGPCTACRAGEVEVGVCTSTSDRVCAACDVSCATCSATGPSACTSCPEGRTLRGSVCPRCATCGTGERVAQACTSTSDTACARCPAGAVSTGSPWAFCAICPAGTAPSPDRASCATCPRGTSSPGEVEACLPCPTGTYTSGEGASTCSACEGRGSCDDGDTCTTDTCDATRGCVHTPTPCAPDAGPPAEAGPIVPPATTSTSARPAEETSLTGGGGCGVARSPETGAWTAIVALVALAARTRRERQNQP